MIGHGPIRVVLEERFQDDAMDIYVLGGKPVSKVLRLIDSPDVKHVVGSMFQWEDIEPLGPPVDTPTMRLPIDLLDAIVDARASIRPADTGATEALADTRATRDRLLKVVEDVIATKWAPRAHD